MTFSKHKLKANLTSSYSKSSFSLTMGFSSAFNSLISYSGFGTTGFGSGMYIMLPYTNFFICFAFLVYNGIFYTKNCFNF